MNKQKSLDILQFNQREAQNHLDRKKQEVKPQKILFISFI